MKLRLLSYTAALLVAVLTAGARSVTDFFTAEGADNVLGLVDRTTRLDMMDYFNSGIAHASANTLGGQASVTAIDSLGRWMSYSPAQGIGEQIAVLDAGKDTVLMVIETLPLPQPDSRISFYDAEWQPLAKRPLAAPVLADWLTADGEAHRQEVEAMLPFMMAAATYNPDTRTLTLAHSMDAYLANKDDKANLQKWLRPSLSYSLKGRKFEPQNR